MEKSLIMKDFITTVKAMREALCARLSKCKKIA